MPNRRFIKLFLSLFVVLALGGLYAAERGNKRLRTAADGQSINYGERITGEISPVGDIDSYSFSGTAGEKVTVQVALLDSPGALANVAVYRPDASLMGETYGLPSPARLDLVLDQTGTHTIIVTEYLSTTTMSYALSLERLTPPSPTAVPISHGQTLSYEIEAIGDLDLFSFSGLAGEKVIVQVALVDGPGALCAIEVYGPDGSMAGSTQGLPSPARLDLQLGQAGTYTVLVSEYLSTTTMDYTVTLESVLPPSPTAGSICPGQTLSGNQIDPIGDFDLFTFEGAAGDRVMFQVSLVNSPEAMAAVELYGPDGALIASDHGLPSPAEVDTFLTQDGTHTILVSEYLSTTTMQYTLSYQCIGTCPCHNQPPDARADQYDTNADEPLSIAAPGLLQNDTDPDDDPLTVVDWDDSVTLGLVDCGTDGSFLYDPNGQFDYLDEGEMATDSFDYTVSDGRGGTDHATVTITIHGVSTGPCPAELLLDGKPFKQIRFLEKLIPKSLLYRFRDEIMAQSAEGREYIALYYKHASEVTSILLRNPDLALRSAAMLARLGPKIEAALAGQRVMLSPEDVAAAEELIDLVAADASPDLPAAIGRVRADLRGGKLTSFFAPDALSTRNPPVPKLKVRAAPAVGPSLVAKR